MDALVARIQTFARRHPAPTALAVVLVAGLPFLSALAGGQGEGIWLVLDMSIKLAAVILLIYACAWGLRALGNGPRFAARPRPLRLVDTLALGDRRAIHVVRVGDRALIVGATPQQITPLGELTPAELEQWDAAQAADPSAQFASVLSRFTHPAD